MWPVRPTAAGQFVGEEVKWVPAERLRVRAYEPFEPLAVHEGVMCDVSGVCPILGNRWKKKGTDDYDLCDAEFQKLTPNQQALFDNIPVG